MRTVSCFKNSSWGKVFSVNIYIISTLLVSLSSYVPYLLCIRVGDLWFVAGLGKEGKHMVIVLDCRRPLVDSRWAIALLSCTKKERICPSQLVGDPFLAL